MSEQDNNPNQTESVPEVFSPEDIEKNKVISGLAYLIFFLPLIACPDSKFGKFHTNQALILWILGIGVGVLGRIPVIGWAFSLLGLAVTIFCIIGAVNAFQGKAVEVPAIGHYRIIK